MKSLKDPAVREDIRRRLRRLSPESRRQWGRMSVDQMVCHLTDGYRMAVGERPVADVSNWWTRTGLKWIGLYAPLPWPKGVGTFPEVDQEVGGTKPESLSDDLERLERALEVFETAAREDRCVDNPFMGKLSSRQWLRWGYLHADHHLRQFGV